MSTKSNNKAYNEYILSKNSLRLNKVLKKHHDNETEPSTPIDSTPTDYEFYYPKLLIPEGSIVSNCKFDSLPVDLIQEIFLWLPTKNFANISSVCSEWYQISRSDEIWSVLYKQKFLNSNPGALPGKSKPYSEHFHDRLKDPFLGDKVEVAWKGKFRLETNDVYQGLSWWRAEIVDKHTEQNRYKIHYPGWESRWDEWVPSSRLRWMAESNIKEGILVGDTVEVWCCGINVPGAWLECKVKKVKGEKYCLGKVLSSGYLWVERERIRLVHREVEELPQVYKPARDTSHQNTTHQDNSNNTVYNRSVISNIFCAIADRIEFFFSGNEDNLNEF